MHKYQAIISDLRHKIAVGEYAQGDRLPTTPELCKQYGVSKITVKRAMDDLESLGLVARRRGSGTYVKGMAGTNTFAGAENVSRRMNDLSPDAELIGGEVTREVHDFLVVQPPTDVAQVLGMEEDEFAYYICRSRFVDGEPDRVEHTYIPLKVVPNLRAQHLGGSLYRYVEAVLGLRVTSMHRAIGARHPSTDEAIWLHVDPQTPLVSVRQVGYLDDGTPFECSTCLHAPGFEFFDVSTR